MAKRDKLEAREQELAAVAVRLSPEEETRRVRVKSDLKVCLERDAQKEGLTVSDIVRRILRTYYQGRGQLAA